MKTSTNIMNEGYAVFRKNGSLLGQFFTLESAQIEALRIEGSVAPHTQEIHDAWLAAPIPDDLRRELGIN